MAVLKYTVLLAVLALPIALVAGSPIQARHEPDAVLTTTRHPAIANSGRDAVIEDHIEIVSILGHASQTIPGHIGTKSIVGYAGYHGPGHNLNAGKEPMVIPTRRADETYTQHSIPTPPVDRREEAFGTPIRSTTTYSNIIFDTGRPTQPRPNPTPVTVSGQTFFTDAPANTPTGCRTTFTETPTYTTGPTKTIYTSTVTTTKWLDCRDCITIAESTPVPRVVFTTTVTATVPYTTTDYGSYCN
ncbi:hypothetical protein B0J14DRAFT_699008 [Halenospora varia]|nr:hypothetical protein B0J14DRAFT_699008 [Halenospora varia]